MPFLYSIYLTLTFRSKNALNLKNDLKMNLRIFTTGLIILSLGIILFACNKNNAPEIPEEEPNIYSEPHPIDENDTIVFSNYVGFSVYKTKADYFYYISLRKLPDGQLNAVPAITSLNDPGLRIDDSGEIVRISRWKLKSGYIVDYSASFINAAFTNITFEEYANYSAANGVAGMPDELLNPRIIDTDPYIEFYHIGCLDCNKMYFTLGQINQMLENGTIDEIFDKLK